MPLDADAAIHYPYSLAMLEHMMPAPLTDILDFDPATLRVSSRESAQREFKERFDSDDLATYVRTLAAFANNNGGTILFGVADKPRRVGGIDSETVADEATWTDCIRSHFDPAIDFTISAYTHGRHNVIAVTTTRSETRPILCKKGKTKMVIGKKGERKDVPVLVESAIYYRYAGQTRQIGYPELAELLAERDARRMRALMDTLKIMDKVGYDRIGIVDASRASRPGKSTKLYVSSENAKALNLIDRGRFVETEEEGDPAYVIVGTVELNEVMRAPPDEADKNLPTETSSILKPYMEVVYWPGVSFSHSHLTKLAAFVGLRADPRYCIEEKKLNRIFYTRAGIERLKEAVLHDPRGALASFASKATLAQYDELHMEPAAPSEQKPA